MLIVFLNNKLISCDTVVPLTYELAQKYPGTTVEFHCFDKRTYDQIKENVVLFEALSSIGTLKLFTDHKRVTRHQNPAQRIFFKLRAAYNLLRLIILSTTRRARIVHFKALNDWPLKILYLLNRNRTFLFEATTAGVTDVERASDSQIQERNYTEELPAAAALVSFSGQWPILDDPRIEDLPRFILFPPYKNPCWQEYLQQRANTFLSQSGIGEDATTITYILSSMDNVGVLDAATDFLELFEETLTILRDTLPEVAIAIKRHPATKPEFVAAQDDAVARVGHAHVHFTNVHPMVLARISTCFIANAYSTTFDAAHFCGRKTIEYTRYPKEILQITDGNSTRPDLTDVFIQQNPEILHTALTDIYDTRNAAPIRTREDPDIEDRQQRYDDLLARLAGRPALETQAA